MLATLAFNMQPLAQFSLHTKPIFNIDLKASCESGLQAGAVMWKVRSRDSIWAEAVMRKKKKKLRLIDRQTWEQKETLI